MLELKEQVNPFCPVLSKKKNQLLAYIFASKILILSCPKSGVFLILGNSLNWSIRRVYGCGKGALISAAGAKVGLTLGTQLVVPSFAVAVETGQVWLHPVTFLGGYAVGYVGT